MSVWPACCSQVACGCAAVLVSADMHPSCSRRNVLIVVGMPSDMRVAILRNPSTPPFWHNPYTGIVARRHAKCASAEAAIASFLSPDALDQREAAFTRRLDKLARQMGRIERDQRITADMLALFVRFWLAVTPPLPEDAQSAASIKGRERYEGFIQTLGRQVQKGRSVLREIPDDVDQTQRSPASL